MTPTRYAALWRDPTASIVWMSLEDALQRPWLDPEKRAVFDDAYQDLLNELIARNHKRSMEDRLHSAAKSSA